MARSTKPTKRHVYLLRTYGITEAQYNDLLKKQKDKCAVCGKPSSEERTALHVDHDHKTGELRGLLCGHCNHWVVGRHRDANLIAAAARYLKGPFTGWFMPPKKSKKRKRRR